MIEAADVACLSRLGVGAQQFGLAESASGRFRSAEHDAREILSIAAAQGVVVLDVGHLHGAESLVIGAMPQPCPFHVVLHTLRADKGPAAVEAEARRCLDRLGIDQGGALMVQSAGDLCGPHGAELWRRLRQLKDEGLFQRIGVSCFASDDPVGVAKRFKPDVMQVPASLLDQRLILDGTLRRLNDLGVAVHLRSIFLQGLLFLPPDRVPGPLKGASSAISRVRRLIAEGRSDPMRAALSFALNQPEAEAVMVGVTTPAEMNAIIGAALHPSPDLDWDDMAMADPGPLDAQQWVAA